MALASQRRRMARTPGMTDQKPATSQRSFRGGTATAVRCAGSARRRPGRRRRRWSPWGRGQSRRRNSSWCGSLQDVQGSVLDAELPAVVIVQVEFVAVLLLASQQVEATVA